jgi:hypothetical protein
MGGRSAIRSNVPSFHLQEFPISWRRRVGIGCLLALGIIFSLGTILFFKEPQRIFHEILSGRKIVVLSGEKSTISVLSKEILADKEIGTSEEEKSTNREEALLDGISLSCTASARRACQERANFEGAADFFSKNLDLVGKQATLKGTSLNECHCDLCVGRSMEGLTYATSGRPSFESTFVNAVAGADKSKPIKICSLCSGGLLEELILHTNLSYLGFQVEWTLNDKSYFDTDGQLNVADERIKDFERLTKAISERFKCKEPTFEYVQSWDALRRWMNLRVI